MLKRRIIPVLNIMGGHIVRSEDFSEHKNIGNIVNQARRYNEWNVDELVYLDINRTPAFNFERSDHKISGYASLAEVIERISSECFMPLAFGGGIRSIEDVDLRINSGADKVVINSAFFDQNNKVIEKTVRKYGSQSLVVSLDYKKCDDLNICFSEFGKVNTNQELLKTCLEAESRGAGEIFINSIDRDGKGCGFDIETIREVCEKVKIPIIGCGGAGTFDDFIDLALETEVSALAGGNIFHFTERSYPRLKKELIRMKINVR